MSEKTEEPTDKKLEDAKKKGQSPKSQDIVAAAVLILSLLTLSGAGEAMLERMRKVVSLSLAPAIAVQTNEAMFALATQMLIDGLVAALPLVIVSVLAAVIALFAQIGFIITFEPLTPKFDKLNPAEGLKKIFSPRSLIEFVKTLVKAAALGAVLWVIIRGLVPLAVGSAYLPLAGSAAIAWKSLLDLLAASCVVFLVLAPADFGLQRWLFIRDQRMSKDDIKREHKESEGDPHVKGQRRALQQEMATSAPQERMAGATAVVTNPTHYAVAIRYDPDDTPVPVVVAKGVDEGAALIRALAQAHGVPMVANPPLARALHKVPLDQTVPRELFDAVALVLRWVAELDRHAAPPAASAAHATHTESGEAR